MAQSLIRHQVRSKCSGCLWAQPRVGLRRGHSSSSPFSSICRTLRNIFFSVCGALSTEVSCYAQDEFRSSNSCKIRLLNLTCYVFYSILLLHTVSCIVQHRSKMTNCLQYFAVLQHFQCQLATVKVKYQVCVGWRDAFDVPYQGPWVRVVG